MPKPTSRVPRGVRTGEPASRRGLLAAAVRQGGAGPQSVRRALELLTIIARSSTQLGVTELAKRLHVHPSTASRLLSALESYQLVTQDPETERFDLGPACLQLGQVFLSRVEITEVAEPFMHSLSRETGLASHLAVLRAGRLIHLKHVLPEFPVPIRPVMERYSVGELHSEALGKVLLAFQPDDVLRQMLNSLKLTRFTDATITTRERLWEEIERVRQSGYAVDRGECVAYIRCVAVPIWNHTGRVEAALSVSGSPQQLPPRDAPRLAEKLSAVAREISARIGGRVGR